MAEGNRFRWEDDSAVDYDNWAQDQPKADDKQKCVRMESDGLWKTVNCSLTSSHVCMMQQCECVQPFVKTVVSCFSIDI